MEGVQSIVVRQIATDEAELGIRLAFVFCGGGVADGCEWTNGGSNRLGRLPGVPKALTLVQD